MDTINEIYGTIGAGGRIQRLERQHITAVAVAQPFSFTVIPKNKMKTDLFKSDLKEVYFLMKNIFLFIKWT